MNVDDIPTPVLDAFRDGGVIPAHPLALAANRSLDERRQRALSRYYLDSGAVGLAVTQLAVAKGARVIGTVSRPGKGDRARAYGAQLIIDRSAQDFVAATRQFTDGAGVDLVIDSLGGDILPRSIDLLKTYGHAINIGEAAGYPDFDIRSKLYENSTFLAGFEVLHAMRVPGLWQKGVADVMRHLASGALEMPVEEIFPFDAVRDLHRRLESRAVSGKLLLRVAAN